MMQWMWSQAKNCWCTRKEVIFQGGWLTNVHIDFAQQFLSKQFTHLFTHHATLTFVSPVFGRKKVDMEITQSTDFCYCYVHCIGTQEMFGVQTRTHETSPRKEVILQGGWLTNVHIDFAQQFLSKQFTHLFTHHATLTLVSSVFGRKKVHMEITQSN